MFFLITQLWEIPFVWQKRHAAVKLNERTKKLQKLTLFITLFNLNLLLQTIKLITAHKVLFWKQLMGFCCINFVQLIRSRIENKSTKRLQVMKSMNAKLLFIKRNLITFKVD